MGFLDIFKPKFKRGSRVERAKYTNVSGTKVESSVQDSLNMAYSDITQLISGLSGATMNRKMRNNIYMRMRKDGLLSNVLNVISADIVPKNNNTKHKIDTVSDFKKYKKYADDWLHKVIGVDRLASTAAYMFALFGECFIDTGYLRDNFDIDKSKWVIITNPDVISAVYNDEGELIGYLDERDPSNKKLAPKEAFIHLCRTGGLNRESIKLTTQETETIRYWGGEYHDQQVWGKQEFYIEYGTSVLEGTAQDYNTLKLIETALLIARLTRSPYFRVWNIEVKDSGDAETKDIIDTYKRRVGEHENINIDNMQYVAGQKTLPIGGDVFVPTRNGKAVATIQPVGIDVNIREAYDLDYWLKKVISSLGIPDDLISMGDDGGVSVGDTSLNRRSAVYSRKIDAAQDDFEFGLSDGIDFFMLMSGFSHMQGAVKAQLSHIYSTEQQEREEAKEKRMANISAAIGILGEIENLPDFVDKAGYAKHIFNKILDDPDMIKFIDISKLKGAELDESKDEDDTDMGTDEGGADESIDDTTDAGGGEEESIDFTAE